MQGAFESQDTMSNIFPQAQISTSGSRPSTTRNFTPHIGGTGSLRPHTHQRLWENCPQVTQGNGLHENARKDSPTVEDRYPKTGADGTIVKLCHYCCQHGSLRCARCKKVFYCSAVCQAHDWTAHRYICKAVVPPVAASEASQEHLTTPNRTGPVCMVAKVTVGPMGDASPKRVHLINVPKNKVTKGAHLEATVVELRNPGKFFIHMKTTVASLRRITTSLQRAYSGVPSTEYTPECGEVCAARYSQDQNWYRGVVQTIDIPRRTAHIFYMDFGNEETVTLDRLKPLAPGADLFPPCAMECRVAGITVATDHWSEECIAAVRQLVVGKKLTVTVVDILDTGVCAVDILLNTGKWLCSFLVDHSYAAKEPGGSTGLHIKDVESILNAALQDFNRSAEWMMENTEVQPPDPPIHSLGDVFYAVVTHLQSPDMVICQKLDNANEIQELQESLCEYCSSIPAVENFRPTPGSVCCSRFSEDGQWYRTRVLDYSTEGHAHVRYIDFGNVEEVELSCLRPIPPTLLRLPVQAIPCALSGVKPELQTWTDTTLHTLRLLVANRILHIKVVGCRGTTTLVTMTDESRDPQMDVAKGLIAKGCAVADDGIGSRPPPEQIIMKSSGTVEPLGSSKWRFAELPVDGQVLKLVVSVIRSPGEFYCRHSNAKDVCALVELSAALVQHCKKNSASFVPSVGQPCCALFPGDGSWYRALVQSVGSDEKARVIFVDYGNTSDVDLVHLRAIQPEHLLLPFQALPCWLAGVEPMEGQWSIEALQRFQTLCLDLPLEARVCVVTERGYGVDLVHGGVSVTAILVSEKLARSTVHSKARVAPAPPVANMAVVTTGDAFPTDWCTVELPISKTFQPHIAAVVNPGLFYVLFANKGDAGKLQALMGELASHCTSRQATWLVTPEPGAACCARFSGDEKWHRAVVLETTESEAKVIYADYGNTERIPLSAICPIAKEHLELPFCIVRCALEGLKQPPSVWPSSILKLFESMLQESLLAFVHRFDGTSYQLTLTGYAEQRGTSINTIVLHTLEQMQSSLAPEFSRSQVNSGGPNESFGSRKTESEHPTETAGGEGNESKVKMNTKETELQLNPEVSTPLHEDSDVACPINPKASCCCMDLRQKIDQIEKLLVQLMKQLGGPAKS
ncbi:tudor domain-containing protein 1 isoform X1 [Arapaima gigas]